MLTFNSKIDSEEEPKIIDAKIRIPLTPIEVNPFILYHLFEVLYPRFINDHNNILDIVISNDGRNVKNLFFYETKKAGIHESVDKLPHDIIRFHRHDLDDINKFYRRTLDGMIKKKKIKISSIRIFKEKAIEAINQYCVNVEDLPLNQLIVDGLDLFQSLLEQDSFIIHPEPTLIRYLKELISFLNGKRLSSIFSLIYLFLPDFNLGFVLGSEKLTLVLHMQKLGVSESELPYLRLKLMIPEELGIGRDVVDKNELLNLVQDYLQTEKVYFLNQIDIVSFLTDLINTPVKIKGKNLKLLFQKVLFGLRSFENHWYLNPRPPIFNNLVRFLIRLFGFNLNLRKISHWAIPEWNSEMIRFNLGLNSKILLIISDITKFKKINKNDVNYLARVAKFLFLIEIENDTVVQIHSLKKEELNIEKELNSWESFRSELSKKFGFLSNIIIIDKVLLQNFIQNFIYEHSRIAPRSKMKTVKMIKNPKFFYIFPEISLYKLIRKKSSLSLIKLFLPIIIDKHEF
ncbi:MAG: hypothetical protein ACFFDB_12705 [Promethearchaeota archaeon]